MPRRQKDPLVVSKAQIESFLSYTTNIGLNSVEKYPEAIVRLDLSPIGAEQWLQQRQINVKWNTKRSHDEITNPKRRSNPKYHTLSDFGTTNCVPKKRYDWTEHWVCGHAGKYRDEPHFWLRKQVNQDVVEIEYIWEHDGHNVGTLGSMMGSMLPLCVKSWIEDRVQQCLDWKAIKSLLRIDSGMLEEIDAGRAHDILDSLHIAHMDIYNALWRSMKKLAHLDHDGYESLTLWKTKLEEKGYSVYYEQNVNTGQGVPATFMITPKARLSEYTISDFILWLCVTLGFHCNIWMLDCSDVEAAVTIFLCLWHVMKAVCEQSKKKLSGSPEKGVSKVEANRRLRESAVKNFKKLVYAMTTDEFEEQWSEIQSMYAEHSDWLKYLRSEWYSKKERWGMAWWVGKAHYKIDTNNYVESWRCQLKLHYLKLMRRQRLDVMLFILTEQVEPDFRCADTQVSLDFSKPRLCLAESESQRMACMISSEDVDDMVQAVNEMGEKTPDLWIRSFTDDDLWYRVHVEGYQDQFGAKKTSIVECECMDQVKNWLKCKHMFLASRFSGLPIHQLSQSHHIPKASAPVPDSSDSLLTRDVKLAKKAILDRHCVSQGHRPTWV
ncbi:hypothetical protein C8J56DRAFT_785384 [Mycena floridula]|nr:hypothetical protein C8J56DRAFT_785384 [Mycena floridula]